VGAGKLIKKKKKEEKIKSGDIAVSEAWRQR
jgi:hypothetical protein